MKAKLNLTIDEKLSPASKSYARSRGISVSQLVEELLKTVTHDENLSFSQKWRGKFKATEKSDSRYGQLKERYKL